LSERKKAFDVDTDRRKIVDNQIEQELIAEDRKKAMEARRLRLELVIQRRKKDLEELKRTPKIKKDITNTRNGLLQRIMDTSNVNPSTIKAFSNSLNEEDILKLNLLYTSSSNGIIQALLPLIKNEGTKITKIITIERE